jgi:hypothetical protein
VAGHRRGYEDKKNLAFEWFGWDDDTKFQKGYGTNMIQFAQELKIAYGTLCVWKRMWTKIDKKLEAALDEDASYNSMSFWKKNSKYVDQCLMRGCEKGNPNAIKLVKQITGELIEKREDTLKLELSPDQVARRMLAITRDLRERGFRVDEMQVKSGILPDPLCISEGQRQTTDNTVGAVETPDRTGGDSPAEKTDTGIQE